MEVVGDRVHCLVSESAADTNPDGIAADTLPIQDGDPHSSLLLQGWVQSARHTDSEYGSER